VNVMRRCQEKKYPIGPARSPMPPMDVISKTMGEIVLPEKS